MDEQLEIKIETNENAERKKGFFKNFRTDRDFSLFLIVGIFSGIATGIYTTIFNNYLSDVYKLSADNRGIVEFPREMPGAFIVVVLAFLAFLGDIRIAVLGMLAASLGMFGLGLFSPTFAAMLIWMMVFSLGLHMILPTTPAIGMSLSKEGDFGSRLARYSAYSLYGTIFAYVFVWVGFKYFGLTYQIAYLIAAAFYILAAISMGFMKSNKPQKRKIRFVFRKKYTLYYVLCVVNGARKQIFMTFAPWVLIQVFGLDAPVFAVLGVIIAAVSILTRTIVGRTIDRKGERFILSIEAVILFVICLGYAFAGDIFTASVAVIIIAICYVLDNSMSAVEMARSTYIRRIVVDPSDVTPTLSTGTSIDHVVSMSMPFLGGLLWAAAGYQYVFLVAAGIALLNLFLSRKIET